jgi:hypothetical protein
MRKFLITLLLLSVFSVALAQVSTGKAALFSLAVPGSGHLYLEDYNKGGIYLGAELAIILSYLRLNAEKEWKIDSYQYFAQNKAGLNSESSDYIYQKAQDYMSLEDYNNGVIQTARNYFLIGLEDKDAYETYLSNNLLPEENSWHWDNARDWQKYKDLRREKQDLEIYANFAIAAAILNRIVSTIDAMVTSKHIKDKLENLTIKPDFEQKGMQVSYEINF